MDRKDLSALEKNEFIKTNAKSKLFINGYRILSESGYYFDDTSLFLLT